MCYFGGNETHFVVAPLQTSWTGRKSPVKVPAVICLLSLMPAISTLFDPWHWDVFNPLSSPNLIRYPRHLHNCLDIKQELVSYFFTISLDFIVAFCLTKFISPKNTLPNFSSKQCDYHCILNTSALNAALFQFLQQLQWKCWQPLQLLLWFRYININPC